MKRTTTFVIGALLGGAPFHVQGQEGPGMEAWGITAVPGIELGHHTLRERPTGCTVILARAGAVGGVDVRGSAPGTRETDLLRAENLVDEVHGISLSGGSAFGLDAASGVVRYLEEHGHGWPDWGSRVVPIVPAAVLYDLGLEADGQKIRPGADCGYAAAAEASSGRPAEGSVGAGAGATVGKLGGMRRAMKGGFGTASITLQNGLVVAAAVAVNAVGDVVDPATGRVVAGVRTEDGRGLADARLLMRGSGGPGDDTAAASAPGTNTTPGVVATNATLTKAQANKVAQMAQDGFARAMYPAHTMNDGDVIFSLATGELAGAANVTLIGALAADAIAEAILRAVRMAEGLPGIPSVSELGR